MGGLQGALWVPGYVRLALVLLEVEAAEEAQQLHADGQRQVPLLVLHVHGLEKLLRHGWREE